MSSEPTSTETPAAAGETGKPISTGGVGGVSVPPPPPSAINTGTHPRRSTTNDSILSRRRSNPDGTGNGNGNDPALGGLKRRVTELFEPEKNLGEAPGYMKSFMAAMKSSWLNVLLVFIPISWALHFAIDNDTAIFLTCFVAIIPLAALLGFATEELAMRVGQTLGGLLNATLGNAVELIVAILALIKCELQVVQSSLIGSILSNLLLVLGMCFFAGGTRFSEQKIQLGPAQLNSSILLLAVICILIPSAFHFSITTSADGSGSALTSAQEADDILKMSRGVAVLMLLTYLGYLLFQLGTHKDMYTDETILAGTQYPASVTNYGANLQASVRARLHRRNKSGDLESEGSSPAGDTRHAMAHVHGTSTALEKGPTSVNGNDNGDLRIAEEGHAEEEEEEEEIPQMNLVVTVLLLLIDTVLVGVTAEFLVSSINGLVSSNPSLSQEWVGLILLPIVGNAAEHVTAVVVSVKDKLDLSISVAVGSSIQIAIFVIPVITLLGACIGKPLTLLFDPFESVVLLLSVLLVNQTLSDGRSNYMEGICLMMIYVIIALVFWFYPGSNTADLVANILGPAGCD